MKNTGVSSIVCFTILVLPVLLDEEYWSFQYCVLYNTNVLAQMACKFPIPKSLTKPGLIRGVAFDGSFPY
jgi:hypothetical protein